MYTLYCVQTSRQLIPGEIPHLAAYHDAYPTVDAAVAATEIDAEMFARGYVVTCTGTGKIVAASPEVAEIIESGAEIPGSPAARQAALASLFARMTKSVIGFTSVDGQREYRITVDFVAPGQQVARLERDLVGLSSDSAARAVEVCIRCNGSLVKFAGNRYLSASGSVLRSRFAEDHRLAAHDWADYAAKNRVGSTYLMAELAGEIVPRATALADILGSPAWELPADLVTGRRNDPAVLDSIDYALLASNKGANYPFPGAGALRDAVDKIVHSQPGPEPVFPDGHLPDCETVTTALARHLAGIVREANPTMATNPRVSGERAAHAALEQYPCACELFKALCRSEHARIAALPPKEAVQKREEKLSALVAKAGELVPGSLPCCSVTVAASRDRDALVAYLEAHFAGVPARVAVNEYGGETFWVNDAYREACRREAGVHLFPAWQVAQLEAVSRAFGSRTMPVGSVQATISIPVPLYHGVSVDETGWQARVAMPDGTVFDTSVRGYGRDFFDHMADDFSYEERIDLMTQIAKVNDLVKQICKLNPVVGGDWTYEELLAEMEILAAQADQLMQLLLLAPDGSHFPYRSTGEHAPGCVDGGDFLKALFGASKNRNANYRFVKEVDSILDQFGGRCLCKLRRAYELYRDLSAGEALKHLPGLEVARRKVKEVTHG